MELIKRGYNTEFEILDGGVKRKILSYDASIMLVEVHFETNSIGSLHKHEHLQGTYVLKGEFEFTIDEKQYHVREGDSILLPPNIEHGVVCHQEGILLDIFNPCREDFLN